MKFPHCARLPDTNLIVITGGYDGKTHRSTEILDLDHNTITLGNSMNSKRASHGMAVITVDNEDRLAVFGGYHRYFRVSVETLNPKTREWEFSDLKLKERKREFGYISLHNDFIAEL